MKNINAEFGAGWKVAIYECDKDFEHRYEDFGTLVKEYTKRK